VSPIGSVIHTFGPKTDSAVGGAALAAFAELVDGAAGATIGFAGL
jgi:hypothetical protein